MYSHAIDELLEQHMTEKGFTFWKAVDKKIPPVWDRLASSTKKYHRKEDGHVPTIAEHTYEMLLAGVELMRSLELESNTEDGDAFLLAIVLHDARKYGKYPDATNYTSSTHGKLMADSILQNKENFLKVFSESNINVIEEAVRYHDGKWSTDARQKPGFGLEKLSPITLLVHFLDMMSSRNLIKVKE